MKRHYLLASAALAAASLLATVPAVAGDHGDWGRHSEKRCGGHDGHDFGASFKSLKLTDAQKSQIKNIREKQKTQFEDRRKEMRETQKALMEAARADKYDAAKVRELANKQGKLIADATVQRIETMRQIHAVLTPEQKQKLEERRKRHEDDEDDED
ncbi:MAG: Spy/CpxP family protein refolding chaperone [Methylobacillus sp.]|jgi:Spy/CpxP family protein refolding chaperone|nr:Spy/CpxP family protein refolding chaperone [Methylobacillus sp.]